MLKPFRYIAASLLISGCGGSSIRCGDVSNIGLSSVSVGGYDIPVVSISKGLSVSANAATNKAVCFGVRCSITNDFEVLGIYRETIIKSYDINGGIE